MPHELPELPRSRLVLHRRRCTSRLACVALAAGLILGACADSGDNAGRTTLTTAESPPRTGALITPPPVRTSAATPTTSPGSTAAGPSAPASTRPPGPVAVHAVSPPPIAPEVLYQASVGSGVQQLGFDDCDQCDPARPLSPMVTSDGRLVILDTANRRWVTVTGGVPTVVPLPADLGPGQLVMGPGDMVYVTMFPLGGGPTELVTFDSRDLGTVVARQAVDEPSTFPALRLDGADLVLTLASGQHAERRLPLTPAGNPPLPSVTSSFATEPKTMTVTGADGVAREYVFDPGMSIGIPVPLGDGSVVLFSNQADGTAPPHTIVYRLLPDGSIATGRIDGEDESLSRLVSFVDERGVVELRRSPDGGWMVVRFPLSGSGSRPG